VQSAYAVPQTPQNQVTVTYGAAQTAGDLNVVVIGWANGTGNVISVTDTSGNAYAIAANTTRSSSDSQSIYYAKNIASSSAGANTVTITFNTALAYPDVRIAEYSGIDRTNPLDGAAGASGSGTLCNSGLLTTTNGTDLLIGANDVSSVTSTAGSGFTNRVITSPDGDILEDRVVTSTGSYTATAPISSGTWVMQIVAFKAASAP
jgi:hypothetical protein